MDIKTKQVTAIKPTPACRALYGVGIKAGLDTPVKLMFHDKTPILLEMVVDGGDWIPPRNTHAHDLDE